MVSRQGEGGRRHASYDRDRRAGDSVKRGEGTEEDLGDSC
jgi:hypothetical protein